MLNKLATLIVAAAFGLAVYSPSADACPGAEKNETSIAKKDKNKDKAKSKKKVADKKKAKDKNKSKNAKDKDKDKDGKKVSRK